MTIQVRYELRQVCILEFEDQEELDEWDNNGACVEDADVIKEETDDDWSILTDVRPSGYLSN